jgi:hypothetical protein
MLTKRQYTLSLGTYIALKQTKFTGSTEADEVARLVLDQFESLPAKRKPTLRGNGIKEWVPLSGIVAKGQYSAYRVSNSEGH